MNVFFTSTRLLFLQRAILISQSFPFLRSQAEASINMRKCSPCLIPLLSTQSGGGVERRMRATLGVEDRNGWLELEGDDGGLLFGKEGNYILPFEGMHWCGRYIYLDCSNNLEHLPIHGCGNKAISNFFSHSCWKYVAVWSGSIWLKMEGMPLICWNKCFGLSAAVPV